MCVAANAHLQKIFSKIQNCSLRNSNIRMTTCFVVPLQWLPRATRVRVRVRLIKSAAGPTRTKWLTRVEVMNRVPLRTIEAVIFLKLSHIISLALSGRFLKLFLVLFLLPIAWGHVWAESWRRIVRDTIIRIVVRVVAWLLMGITECGGRDVRSCIMRSVVIAVTLPFMCHTKWWMRINSRSVVWIVVIAMAWASMRNTECYGGVIPNTMGMDCNHIHGFPLHAPCWMSGEGRWRRSDTDCIPRHGLDVRAF
jgi:hypothetical protein